MRVPQSFVSAEHRKSDFGRCVGHRRLTVHQGAPGRPGGLGEMLTGSPDQAGHVARGARGGDRESSRSRKSRPRQSETSSFVMCVVEFPKPRVISEFRDEEGPNLRNTSLTANTQRHCAY